MDPLLIDRIVVAKAERRVRKGSNSQLIVWTGVLHALDPAGRVARTKHCPHEHHKKATAEKCAQTLLHSLVAHDWPRWLGEQRRVRMDFGPDLRNQGSEEVSPVARRMQWNREYAP